MRPIKTDCERIAPSKKTKPIYVKTTCYAVPVTFNAIGLVSVHTSKILKVIMIPIIPDAKMFAANMYL